MSSNSVCNHTRDKQITRMITDRIGFHSVLLPLLIVVVVIVAAAAAAVYVRLSIGSIVHTTCVTSGVNFFETLGVANKDKHFIIIRKIL